MCAKENHAEIGRGAFLSAVCVRVCVCVSVCRRGALLPSKGHGEHTHTHAWHTFARREKERGAVGSFEFGAAMKIARLG